MVSLSKRGVECCFHRCDSESEEGDAGALAWDGGSWSGARRRGRKIGGKNPDLGSGRRKPSLSSPFSASEPGPGPTVPLLILKTFSFTQVIQSITVCSGAQKRSSRTLILNTSFYLSGFLLGNPYHQSCFF
jgi:hypothetical protein